MVLKYLHSNYFGCSGVASPLVVCSCDHGTYGHPGWLVGWLVAEHDTPKRTASHNHIGLPSAFTTWYTSGSTKTIDRKKPRVDSGMCLYTYSFHTQLRTRLAWSTLLTLRDPGAFSM